MSILSKSTTSHERLNTNVSSYILSFLKQFKTLISVHIISLLLFMGVVVGIPFCISKIPMDTDNLAFWLTFIIGLNILISFCIRIYHYYIWVILLPKMQARLYTNVFSGVLDKQYSYYQNSLSGDLNRKRTDIVNEIPNVYMCMVDGFMFTILFVIISLSSLTIMPIKYMLTTGLWCAGFVLLSWYYAKPLATLSKESAQSDTTLNGLMTDIQHNILSVKLYHNEEYEKEKFDEHNATNINIKRKLEKIYYVIFSFYSIAFVFILALCCYFLYEDYSTLLIDISQIVLYLQIAIGLVNRLWQITEQMQRYIIGMGKISQAYQVLVCGVTIEQESLKSSYMPQITHILAEQEKSVLPVSLSLPMMDKPNVKIKKGSIKFDNVSFGYHDDNIIFDNFSLEIPAGQNVGFVGYSGTGKTTLVNLILNLYPLQKGKITIDGYDIKTLPEYDLYDGVSMITQEAMLFHRSVYDNIAYGKLDACVEDVICAAKMAQAHDFIMSLEDKYDTFVGEKGSLLSGGQRQRVMIARSLLKNAKVMILDEVTSQLDSENEFQIHQNLMKVMKGRTAIVIAHRLSTLKALDRLLVFDKGRIIGDGTHDELLVNNHMYRSLWNKQIGNKE